MLDKVRWFYYVEISVDIIKYRFCVVAYVMQVFNVELGI